MGRLTSAVPMGSSSTPSSVDEVARANEVHHCVTLSSAGYRCSRRIRRISSMASGVSWTLWEYGITSSDSAPGRCALR